MSQNILRIIDPAQVSDPGVIAHYRSILAPEEQARVDGFAAEQDRHLRLVARACLRMLLAEVTGIPAQDLRFRYNAHGKPYLADHPVKFNLSHTKDRIAIFISCTAEEVGVDIESVRPMTDLHAIAERHFAPQEAAALRDLSPEAAAEKFFQYWTLKEAYIKARGAGLSLGLSRFWFELDGDEPRIHVPQDDDARMWSVTIQQLDSGHYLATAARRGTGV